MHNAASNVHNASAVSKMRSGITKYVGGIRNPATNLRRQHVPDSKKRGAMNTRQVMLALASNATLKAHWSQLHMNEEGFYYKKFESNKSFLQLNCIKLAWQHIVLFQIYLLCFCIGLWTVYLDHQIDKEGGMHTPTYSSGVTYRLCESDCKKIMQCQNHK